MSEVDSFLLGTRAAYHTVYLFLRLVGVTFAHTAFGQQEFSVRQIGVSFRSLRFRNKRDHRLIRVSDMLLLNLIGILGRRSVLLSHFHQKSIPYALYNICSALLALEDSLSLIHKGS